VAIAPPRRHNLHTVEEGLSQLTGFGGSGRRVPLEELALGLTAAFEGALLLDDELRVLVANAKAVETLGFDSAAELMGRSFDEIAKEGGFPSLTSLGVRDITEQFAIARPAERFVEIRTKTTPSGLVWVALRDVTHERRRKWGDATYAALAKVLVECTTYAEALHQLLSALGKALEWAAAELFLVDRDLGKLRFEASWQDATQGACTVRDSRGCSFSLGEGTLGEAWATGRAIWLEKLADDPSFECRTLTSGDGFKSALAYPVRVGGEIVGVLVFFSERYRGPDDGILRLLAAFDPLIGQFLERLRLFETQSHLFREREKSLERLKLMHGVTTSLGEAVDADEVGRVVLSASLCAVSASSGVLYRYDAERSELYLSGSIDFPQATNPDFQRVSLDLPRLVTEAVRERRPVIVERAEDLARRYPELYASISRGFETWIALPFIAHDRVVGAMGLNFRTARAFSPEDRVFLETLAWQCALALDRARLFEAERSSKEQALAERERFRDILMSAPIPVVVYEGPEHVITMMNPAYEEILRQAGEHEELVGKPLREASEIFRAVSEQIANDLDRIYKNGNPLVFAEYPVPLPTRNGRVETRYFAASAQPIRDADGRVTGIVQLAVDITEQVLARKRQEAARAEAEAETRAKDQFLAMLSHELRTPLQSMLGWTQLLLARPFDRDTVRRGLETIERNTRQQARLIEQLLDVSRIVAGKLRLDKTPLELAELVETAVESMRTEAQQKEIELLVRCERPIRVDADPDRLRQVLFNLLGNALKFTPAGGRVSVSVEQEGEQAKIAVADTGRGIAPAMLARIFEPFRQAEAKAARRQDGLGLGLAIVKHLVELHGGTVRAESEGEGHGATFTVTLPVLQQRVETNEAKQATELEALDGAVAGLRVLVIDDDMDTAEVVALALRHAGAEVSLAASVCEATELYQQECPDLVISDLALGDENGFEMLRRIRRIEAGQAWPRKPAIALTGLARREDHENALRAGYQAHLVKPIAPDELVRTVAAIAARNKRGRAGGKTEKPSR